MLLSIGMIVKNEEKCLRKCLEGIKPILEQVHSELIIADTGSTDGTMEIAREYTKNVYQIEWRNDFAWARNTTLDRARGKWYMFLDADEVFEDTADLIEFFNSGEHEKYKTAMHGMVMISGSARSESKARRIFKIGKNTRFIGTIHEHPINTSPPLKELKSYSVHTGYDYENTSEGAKRKAMKFERNIKPLLVLYNENPNDLRTIIHILKEYHFNNKTSEFLKFLDIGLSVAEKIPRNVYYDFLCCFKAEYKIRLEQREEAVEYIEKYFENVKTLYTLSITMRILEARALRALGRPEEAAKIYEKVWLLYEEEDKGNIDHTDLEVSPSTVLLPDTRNSITAELINYYSRENNFETAVFWGSRSIFGTAVAIDLYLKAQIGRITKEKYAQVPELYGLVTEHFGIGSVEYDTVIENLEKSLETPEAKLQLSEALSSACDDEEDDYITLQKLRLGRFKNDDSTTDEMLAHFLGSDKKYTVIYGDVFIAAMERGADFAQFLDKMGVTAAVSSVAGIVRTTEGLSALIKAYVGENPNIPPKIVCFLCALLRVLLTVDTMDDDERICSFEVYVPLCRHYLSLVYSAESLTDELCELLPVADRFAYYAYRAYEKKADGNYVKFVSTLREAIEADNVLSGVVMTVINRFQEELDDHDKLEQEKREKRKALERETAALKQIIIDLIDKNDKKQAGQILASYEQINPSDPEINSIKQKLENL